MLFKNVASSSLTLRVAFAEQGWDVYLWHISVAGLSRALHYCFQAAASLLSSGVAVKYVFSLLPAWICSAGLFVAFAASKRQ